MSFPACFCCNLSAANIPCQCPQYASQYHQPSQYSPQQHHGSQYSFQGSNTNYGPNSTSIQQHSAYGTTSYQYPHSSQGPQTYTYPQSSGQGAHGHSSNFHSRYNDMNLSQYSTGQFSNVAFSGAAGGGGQPQPQSDTQPQDFDDFGSTDCQNGSIPDDDPNRPRVVVPQQPQAPARRARTVVDYHIDRVSRVQKVIDDYDASLAGSKPGRNVGSSVGRSRRR